MSTFGRYKFHHFLEKRLNFTISLYGGTSNQNLSDIRYEKWIAKTK